MAGNKPAFQMRLRLKKGHGRYNVAGAWPNKFGGYNVTFKETVWDAAQGKEVPFKLTVTLPDGTQLPATDFWCDFSPPFEPAKAPHEKLKLVPAKAKNAPNPFEGLMNEDE